MVFSAINKIYSSIFLHHCAAGLILFGNIVGLAYSFVYLENYKEIEQICLCPNACTVCP